MNDAMSSLSAELESPKCVVALKEYFESLSKCDIVSEPYTELELLEYEAKTLLGSALPKDLRNYLLHVSREVHLDRKPHVFPLDDTNVGTCDIPSNIYFFERHEYEDEDRENTDGMVEVGNDLWIVVKGNRLGSVWHMDSYGNGDLYNYNASFTEAACKIRLFKRTDSTWP